MEKVVKPISGLLGLLIITLTLAASVYFFSRLPEEKKNHSQILQRPSSYGGSFCFLLRFGIRFARKDSTMVHRLWTMDPLPKFP